MQAFLHYILPNLAQSLDDEDAARHIVNKMPDNLAPDKRRMIEWLQETGRWSERKLIVQKSIPLSKSIKEWSIPL